MRLGLGVRLRLRLGLRLLGLGFVTFVGFLLRLSIFISIWLGFIRVGFKLGGLASISDIIINIIKPLQISLIKFLIFFLTLLTINILILIIIFLPLFHLFRLFSIRLQTANKILKIFILLFGIFDLWLLLRCEDHSLLSLPLDLL